MANLTVSLARSASGRYPMAIFNVFLNGQPVGALSAQNPQLIMNELTEGTHTLQVRTGMFSGKSKNTVIQVTDTQSNHVQIRKNFILNMAFPLVFIAVYFALRVYAQLPLGYSAVAALVLLLAGFATIPTIQIIITNSSSERIE